MRKQINRRLTTRLLCLRIAASIFFLYSTTVAVNADEIAIWNFNDSDLVVDHGNGTLTSNFNVANILFAAGTTNNARLGDIAGLSRSEDEAQGAAKAVGEHVDLGGQSAAGTPQSLVAVPPFPVAACW